MLTKEKFTFMTSTSNHIRTSEILWRSKAVVEECETYAIVTHFNAFDSLSCALQLDSDASYFQGLFTFKMRLNI